MKLLCLVAVLALFLVGCDMGDSVGPVKETRPHTAYTVDVRGSWYGVDFKYVVTPAFKLKVTSPDSSLRYAEFTGYPQELVCYSGDRIEVNGVAYSTYGDVGVTVQIRVDSVMVKDQTARGWGYAVASAVYTLK